MADTGIVQDKDATGKLTDEAVIEMFRDKTPDEISRMVDNDASLLDPLERFAALVEKSQLQPSTRPNDGTSTSQQNQQSAISSQGQQLDQGITVDDDQEVQISIKPSLLGTYAKNRPLPEAISELVKGKGEADKTIAHVKSQNEVLDLKVRNLEGENISLKKALEEFKAKQAAAVAQPSPQASAAPEIPEIPEEGDLIDPDNAKAALTAMRTMRDTVLSLRNEISTLKSPPKVDEQPQNSIPATPAVNNADIEFAEIRALQNNPEFADLLQTQTDIRELDRQYSDFVTNLARAAGVQQVFAPNGAYSEGTIRALAAYNDSTTPYGQQIRSLADSQQIKPPDEFDKLNRIYTIRSLRKQYARADGKGGTIPIGYDEAGRFFVTNNPSLRAPSKAQQQVQDHEAVLRGVENRNQFARDPRPSEGSDPQQASAAELEEVNRLLTRGIRNLNEVERATLTNHLRGLKWSDAEIQSFMRPIGGI